MASTGNAIDYGDLTVQCQAVGSLSNSRRGVWGGGRNPSGNVIDYITIATGGAAVDFGDLSIDRENLAGGASNAHGGLNDGNQGVVDT